jgi:hypothetical protein
LPRQFHQDQPAQGIHLHGMGKARRAKLIRQQPQSLLRHIAIFARHQLLSAMMWIYAGGLVNIVIFKVAEDRGL